MAHLNPVSCSAAAAAAAAAAGDQEAGEEVQQLYTLHCRMLLQRDIVQEIRG